MKAMEKPKSCIRCGTPLLEGQSRWCGLCQERIDSRRLSSPETAFYGRDLDREDDWECDKRKKLDGDEEDGQ